MLNFWTKKHKEDLLKNKERYKNFYQNNATTEQQEQIKKVAENTQNQNFTAAEYNEQARKNGEQNWQTAYRRDILGINQEPETEIQKKHRLFAEEQARQEAEYQKRIAKNPEIALPKVQEYDNGKGVFIGAEDIKKGNEEIAKKEQEIAKNLNQNQTQNTLSQPSTQAEGVNPEQNLETKKDTESSVGQNSQDPQTQNIDYQNWNVEGWKARGSSKEELENAVEKKYGTVASWKEDGSLEAVINGEKFSWKIDSNGNPIKTSLGNANQVDINKGQVFQMIQNGNTTAEINDYIHKNNLQDDPDVKNQLKQKYISDYEKPILQKYRNLSLQDLHKAVKNGEVLPGTEVFNKLPQAEAYNQYAKSFAVIDARKERDFTAINSAIDIEKIVEKSISKFFDTKGIEDVTDRWKNDPEIKQYRADVYESQKKIAKLRGEMKNIEKEVRSRMGGSPEGRIQAEIAWQAESILNSIATETALMNASLGMIGDRKGDFEVEMKMLGYKDGLKKEQYMSALSLYKYERGRMDEFKKMELQYKNQEIAFNRQQKAQKEIMELQQKYKGGTYQVGVDGSLNYIVNGQAQRVKFDDGKTLFTKNTNEYSTQTKFHDDGTFSTYTVSKDGKNVNVQTYDMDGRQISGLPNMIASAIAKVGVDGKQCGEGVNDYLQTLGLPRLIQNSWESKKSLIQPGVEPKKGGLAIWNPASVGSKNHKYGHVGIFEGFSPDGKFAYITDWNADGKSEKFSQRREVPMSEITKTGGFFNPEIAVKKDTGKSISGGESSGTTIDTENGDFSKEALAYAEDLGKGKIKLANIPEKIRNEVQSAKIYLEKKGHFLLKETDEYAIGLKDKYDILNDLLTSRSGDLNNISGWEQTDLTNWFFKGKDNALSDVKNILSSGILQTLIDAKANGATFGALSDAELNMLRNASSTLMAGADKNDKGEITGFSKLSEEKFKSELKKIMEMYGRAYERATGLTLNNPAGL